MTVHKSCPSVHLKGFRRNRTVLNRVSSGGDGPLMSKRRAYCNFKEKGSLSFWTSKRGGMVYEFGQ